MKKVVGGILLNCAFSHPKRNLCFLQYFSEGMNRKKKKYVYAYTVCICIQYTISSMGWCTQVPLLFLGLNWVPLCTTSIVNT